MADEESLPKEAITELLRKWGGGESAALRDLIPLVYQELHRLARVYLHRESNHGHGTISATELVNELYLKLTEVSRIEFQNRAHFYGAAASIIRRILVDRSRARRALKRSGEVMPLGDTAIIGSAEIDYLDLHSALERLESLDPRKARVVELRYFAGLSIEGVGELMELSPMTVKREWNFARTWLYEQMQ
ncbi:MAG: sigma-70 family RNA polymerase sigma factor [Acidobacteria bacterium]|nr:sigma-70 family RNA polymerase sigma factor [Acidobacteriota bacterium]